MRRLVTLVTVISTTFSSADISAINSFFKPICGCENVPKSFEKINFGAQNIKFIGNFPEPKCESTVIPSFQGNKVSKIIINHEEVNKPCLERESPISSDGKIRPSENSTLCASHGMNRIKAKLWWRDCNNSDMNQIFYYEETGLGYAYIKSEIGLCWSILQQNNARKQTVFLKKCKNDEKQKWVYKNGVLWYYNSGEDDKFCISFEGEEMKVRTRKCFRTRLGSL